MSNQSNELNKLQLERLSNVIVERCNIIKGIDSEIERVGHDLKVLISSLQDCRDLEKHAQIVSQITDKEYRLKVLQQNSSHMVNVNRNAVNEYKALLTKHKSNNC